MLTGKLLSMSVVGCCGTSGDLYATQAYWATLMYDIYCSDLCYETCIQRVQVCVWHKGYTCSYCHV